MVAGELMLNGQLHRTPGHLEDPVGQRGARHLGRGRGSEAFGAALPRTPGAARRLDHAAEHGDGEVPRWQVEPRGGRAYGSHGLHGHHMGTGHHHTPPLSNRMGRFRQNILSYKF